MSYSAIKLLHNLYRKYISICLVGKIHWRKIKILTALFIAVFLYKLNRKWKKIKSVQLSLKHKTRSNNRHRIVFGGCGNLFLYQMGVMKAIIEIFGTEIFEKCDFEGVSGGAATAGYSCSVVNDCEDMDYWYKIARKASLYTSNHLFAPIFTLLSVNYKIAELGKQWAQRNTKWNKYHQFSVWVTCVNIFGNHFLCNKLLSMSTTTNEISKQMAATTLIPLLTPPNLYYNINGLKCIDGAFADFIIGDKAILKAKNMNNESCKILYINNDFITSRKYDFIQLSNGNIVYYLDIWKWIKFNWREFLPCGDEEWLDGLYNKGYDMAIKHMDEIEVVIRNFIEKKTIATATSKEL